MTQIRVTIITSVEATATGHDLRVKSERVHNNRSVQYQTAIINAADFVHRNARGRPKNSAAAVTNPISAQRPSCLHGSEP